MSELMVLGFENEAAAEEFGVTLAQMQKDMIVQLQDASMVVRDADGKPHVKHGHRLVGTSALGGTFWGVLFGLLFFVPFLGLAIGAGIGTLFGKPASPASTGRCSSRSATPCRRARPAGSWSSAGHRGQVHRHGPGRHATVVRSNLSHEQEAGLKPAFGTEKHAKD